MKFISMIVLLSAMVLLAACAWTPRLAASTQPSVYMPSASPSATAPAAAAQVRSISPADAKARLDSGEEIILLDVRTAEEYLSGHITGSILLPLDELDAKADETLKDKNAIIYVYCRSGRRSKIAAEMLAGMGYTQVFDLGGIIDWPYGTSTN